VILPAKHLRQDRALLDVGAEILAQLQESHTVSELWERVRAARAARPTLAPLSFDWFVLSVTFLYSISALDLVDGLVSIQIRK
jgi:hypothetical protein